ncbi:MAG: hypothetical protein QMB88_07515, partial [Burkholderiaceae bacterium]
CVEVWVRKACVHVVRPGCWSANKLSAQYAPSLVQTDVTQLTSHAQAAPVQAIYADVVSLRTKSPVV